MSNFFYGWQRRSIGAVLTFLAYVAAGVVIIWLLMELVKFIGFLQPALLPFAISAVIAFLLEPIVRFICARTQLSRTWAVSILLGSIVLVLAGFGWWLLPKAYESTATAIHRLPEFVKTAEKRFLSFAEVAQRRITGGAPIQVVSPSPAAGQEKADSPSPVASATPAAQPGATPANGSPPPENASPSPAPAAQPGEKSPIANGDLNRDGKIDAVDLRQLVQQQMPRIEQAAPAVAQKIGNFLYRALGGFLGGFSVLIDAIIIPIYIFFLLIEGRNIAKRWADFLPLQDSQLKQEVVSTLLEINGYLVSFFRGQLVVSTIDGVLIALSLHFFLGLNFAFLIGLLVVVLTFIPYVGIMICYIPIILVAAVQFGDFQHPLFAILIVFGVQTLESTIIAPKIVGESTGLHPLTVIVSIFVWGAILDGPIGALLAVPLTASLKVLMRRYVWDRARAKTRILPTADVQPVLRAGDRDRFGDGEPDVKEVPEVVAHPKEPPAQPEGKPNVGPPPDNNAAPQ